MEERGDPEKDERGLRAAGTSTDLGFSARFTLTLDGARLPRSVELRGERGSLLAAGSMVVLLSYGYFPPS